MAAITTTARTAAAVRAVLGVFALNGFVFAAWVSRLPAVRDALDLSPSRLGVVLLVGAAGSLVSLPLTGAVAERIGSAATTRVSAATAAVGFAGAALAVGVGTTLGVALGLFVASLGIGAWDVSMNIQGAHVEHALGRSVMPRFHAAFSLGAVAGAGSGAVAAAVGVGVPAHVIGSVVVAAGLVAVLVFRYLPDVRLRAVSSGEGTSDHHGRAPSAFAAWAEARTVLIGLVVLAAALTEGSATDWLALAVVDGFGASNAVGALAFGAFVAAMTAMRLAGTALLDRFGRVVVLRACASLALVGLLLFTLGPTLVVALVGVVVWGLGAALGFPVGMSAAADDPARAAARVSVVSSIGYVAFLAGPPLLGVLADEIGYRLALLAIAGPLVLSLVLSPAVRPLRRERQG